MDAAGGLFTRIAFPVEPLLFFFVLCSKALTVQTQPVPMSLLCPWADSQSGSSSLVLWPDTTEEGSSKGGVD